MGNQQAGGNPFGQPGKGQGKDKKKDDQSNIISFLNPILITLYRGN